MSSLLGLDSATPLGGTEADIGAQYFASAYLERLHRMLDANHHQVKSGLIEYISECSSVVGKIESFALQSLRHEKSIIEKNFGRIRKCYKFKRLLHKNIVYHSKEYTKPTRCNSYTVLYKSARGLLEYGFIKFYIKCFNECKVLTHCSELCSCRILFYVAMIDKPQPVDFTGFCLPHVLPFHNKRSELDCCKVDDIQEMCVSLALSLDSNTDFICRFPNCYEKDWFSCNCLPFPILGRPSSVQIYMYPMIYMDIFNFC